MRRLLVLLVLALTDCATLDPISSGACGNGVVDQDEDCDGRAPSAFEKGVCGAPAEGASACRLKCGGAADCPDGWGCSTTGVCRAPSGKFGAIGEGVSAGVTSMVVGDFDGDHRSDIIGSGPQGSTGAAKVRVHYFGDNAALASVNNLSAPISSPTVRDFSGDGVDDFAFGLELGGFGIMTGQLDRSLVPAIFPSGRLDKVSAKPVTVFASRRPVPAGGRFSFLFAGTVTMNDGSVVTELASGTEKTDYQHALPVGSDKIVGDPIWAPLLKGDTESTCGEVAIAMVAETANGVIEVFSPCRPKIDSSTDSAWFSARAPKRIDSPEPIAKGGGIHIVDADGDGNLDILFGTTTDTGTTHVYLAKSTGTDFAAPQITSLAELPLASGNLDGDGKPDFILPSAIAISNASLAQPSDAGPDAADAGAPPVGEPFATYLQIPLGRRIRWTAARIGKFNGDDLDDFVAASEDQPDLDFYGAVGAADFTHSTISTDGPVTRLAIGDFDGDKITDLAFVLKRSGKVEYSDVAIAYGRTNGPPEPPRIIGRTTNVIEMDPLFDPDAPNASLPSLGLFDEEKATNGGLPSLTLAIIVTNGDRQPLAPLLLNDDLSGRPDMDKDVYRSWVPLEVNAGPTIDPTKIDLVALAVGYRISRTTGALAPPPYPSAVWVAPGTGGTSFDPPRAVQSFTDFKVGDRKEIVFDARTVGGDLDNPKDGKWEFVALESPPGKNAITMSIVHPMGAATTSEIPGEMQRRDTPMVLRDVDADGNVDLVALFGDTDAGHVVVIYNDGKGGLVLPPVTVQLPDNEAAKGFTMVTTAGAPAHKAGAAKRELAIVTAERVYLASPAANDRNSIVPREIPREAGSTLASPTAIAAGDFDGDGVEDLAIADNGALRILRGTAKK